MLHREFVLHAVTMATWFGDAVTAARLFTRTKGIQFRSDAWRFRRSNRLEPSVSRKGNCWAERRPRPTS